MPLESTPRITPFLRSSLVPGMKLPTGAIAMLTAGVRLTESTIAIGGLSGAVLVSRDAGRNFTLQQRADRKGLSGAVAAGDEALLVVGEAGIERVALQ